MKIGTAIAKRREQLGLTQEELAQAVGVTKASISRWESGDISNMRRDRIQKLAEALHISPLDLLEEEVNLWDAEYIPEIKRAPSQKTERLVYNVGYFINMDDPEMVKAVESLTDSELQDVQEDTRKYFLYLCQAKKSIESKK